MTTVKALKTRLMKLLTSSFETFPPDRALLLSQAVLKNVCDGLPDTDKYTLAQICEELATQVKNEKVSEEDIGDEIEMAFLDGRMSGKMLDEKVADMDLLRKVTGHHSDLDNPRFILDPKEWIQLSRFHSQSDLNQALRSQYRQVFDCAPHDALFVVGQWLSHAATIRAMPSLKSSYVAIREAILGIEACRARLEFHLGKKVGAINAAAVEAELLDLQLPTDLPKARAAGRKAQKEVRRDEILPDKKPAGKPAAKKSGN